MSSSEYYNLQSQTNALQQLLLVNIPYLDTIVAKTPCEVTLELAESLFNFYLKHDKLEPFFKWAVQKEVQICKSYGELFREDNIYVKVLQCVMFMESHIKYLRMLLGPLLKDIFAMEKEVTIDDSRANEGIKTLLKYIGSFITHFEGVVTSSPSTLKTLFSYIQQCVTEKYPEQQEPYIFSFINFHFVCPILFNPKKYGIARRIPKHSASILVHACKILIDIGANSIEKQKSPLIAEFITTQRSRALGILLKGMNSASEKQTNPIIYSEDERKLETFTILALLDEIEKKQESTSGEILTSPDMFNHKLKKFHEKLHHPGWKKIQEKHGATYYTLKEEGNGAIAIKTVSTIEASVDLIDAAINEMKFAKEYHPTLCYYEVLRKSENYEENYLQHKLPFPFANRDVAISLYYYKPTPYLRIHVVDNLSSKVCKKRAGFVRSSTQITGYHIESDESNPNRSVVNRILHISLGGSIPTWFSNFIIKDERKKMKVVRSIAEKNQRMRL